MKKASVIWILGLLASTLAGAANVPTFSEVDSPASIKALAGTHYTNYQISKVRSFKVNNVSPLKRTIELYVAVQVGSPWLSGDQFSSLLSAEMPKALQVFSQCGFGFDQVHVLYLNYNAAGLKRLVGYESSDPYDPPFEFGLLQDLPQVVRPVVVLNKQGYAESFNAESVQRYAESFDAPISKIQDMSFVPSDTAVSYNKKMLTQDSYSLFAHEMGHVLGNLQHVKFPTPNLMSAAAGSTPQQSGKLMNSDLTADQCRAILNYSVGSK